MAKENVEEKKSILRAMLEDGCIGQFFTMDGYMLYVRPCLQIDKVKFSFVKKGTEGQQSLEAYLDVDVFDNLCDDILTKVLDKKIANQKSTFPDAWSVNCGEGGSTQINIGKASNPNAYCVIQGRYQKINAMVPVPNYGLMKSMAKHWKRVSSKYYEGLAEICIMAMNKAASYHQANAFAETTFRNANSPDTEKPPVEATPKEKSVTSKPNTPSSEHTESSKPATNNQNQADGSKEKVLPITKGNMESYTLIPNGELIKSGTDAKPSYTLNCRVKGIDESIEVVFLSGAVQKNADEFNNFLGWLEDGGSGPFKIEGILQDYNGTEQIRFAKFVPRKKV